jgi:hypothetical protein
LQDLSRSQSGHVLRHSLQPPFPPFPPKKNNLKYFNPCISPFSFSHFFFSFPTEILNFPLVFWLAFQSQIETSSSHLPTTIPEYNKITILTDNKYCHHVPYRAPPAANVYPPFITPWYHRPLLVAVTNLDFSTGYYHITPPVGVV